VLKSSNRGREALGSVYDVMIDKRSGDVVYAVMSFGGFLGIGKSYHPVPWNKLDYDEAQSGYVVDVDKEMLEKAPTYALGQEPNWRITVTFVRSTIITAARTAFSDLLMLSAQPRTASLGRSSRASDARSVVDRYEEQEFDRTKKDHPGFEGSEHEESAWSYQREVGGPEEPIKKSPRHGNFNADRTRPATETHRRA
jgi:hypothetical protein